MKKSITILTVLVTALLLLVACGTTEVEVPVEVTRLVENEVQVEVTRVVENMVETEVEVTRVVEVAAEAGDKVVVEFWSTDNEEARVNAYEAVAERFMAENPGIEVRIIPIEEGGISQRIATAVAANRLPDIVRMGVERVSAFAADGFLDEEAAQAVIASIGEDDFRAAPLRMVTNPTTGNYAAVPYDGWIQALWYRTDIFNELGLEAPTSWDAINAACDALTWHWQFALLFDAWHRSGSELPAPNL